MEPWNLESLLYQEGSYLPPQFVLDVIDRSPRVDDPEVKFVGHRSVFAKQLVLVGAEAVVDVVAVLQVHARFPEIHAARFEDPPDQRFDIDLQIEDEVWGNGEAVQIPEPRAIDAAHAGARQRRENVPIRQHDETGFQRRDDF